MRRRLRRFAAVGVLATAADVTLAWLLTDPAGWPLPAADAVALVVASGIAFLLHRVVTLRDEPFARWIHSPWVFGTVVVAAGTVDIAVFWSVGDSRTGWALVGAKGLAVAAAAVVRGLAYRSILFRVVRREQMAPSRRPGPDGAMRLSVVIPAYREADRIGESIHRIRAALAADGEPVEIVVVDDGSDDATAERAEAAGADVVLRLERNHGKGGAVRAGVLAAKGRFVAFTDADLAYAPQQIRVLVDRLEDGYDVVVGNRRHVATRTLVRAGRLREAGGRLVNVATHALLLGQYHDTQCGLKAFRRDVGQALFSVGRLDGFAFDVELFHLAERWRLSVAEVPVTVENSARSTVHVVRDGLRLVADLIRIRGWARRGAYRQPPLPEPVGT